jgi:hypothetical protein
VSSLLAFILFAHSLGEVTQEIRVVVWGHSLGSASIAFSGDWSANGQIKNSTDWGEEYAEENPNPLGEIANRFGIRAGGKYSHENRKDHQNYCSKYRESHGLTLTSQNID